MSEDVFQDIVDAELARAIDGYLDHMLALLDRAVAKAADEGREFTLNEFIQHELKGSQDRSRTVAALCAAMWRLRKELDGPDQP